MTIGDVFARAWDLWRRSVGWLILAGLLVGIIMVALSWVLSRLLVYAGLTGALPAATTQLVCIAGSFCNSPL